MGLNYSLHIVPTAAEYLPAQDCAVACLDLLVQRLRLPTRPPGPPANGEWRFRERLPEEACSRLFGWNPQSEDADERFWAFEVGVRSGRSPMLIADWEEEADPPRLRCPQCAKGLQAEVRSALAEESELRDLECWCGAKTAWSDLLVDGRARIARFVLEFLGNKGWHREDLDDRKAFKDRKFLADLERALGTPVDAISVVS